MKNILDLTNQEAKEFFLAEERYFTFDLPKYFSFNKILKKLAEKLSKEYEKASEKFNGAKSPIIISEEVYKDFEVNPEFGLYNCHDGDTDILVQKNPVFIEVTDLSDDTLGDKFYYTQVGWCIHCADDYINKIN